MSGQNWCRLICDVLLKRLLRGAHRPFACTVALGILLCSDLAYSMRPTSAPCASSNRDWANSKAPSDRLFSLRNGFKPLDLGGPVDVPYEELPAGFSEQSIFERFEAVAARHPHAVAVVGVDEQEYRSCAPPRFTRPRPEADLASGPAK